MPTDAISDQGKPVGAVDELYRVFGHYPPPTSFRAPPYREPEALLRDLLLKPLRETDVRPVGLYAFWALTTVFDDGDGYRHFLPRILDLATQNAPYSGLDPPIIGGKLVLARWHAWPEREQEAVQACFVAMWDRYLEQPRDEVDPESWLVGALCAGMKLEHFTARWLYAPLQNGMLHLANFVSSEKQSLRTRGFPNGPWWDGVDVAIRRQLTEWLLSDPIRKRLGEASRLKNLDPSEFYSLAYACGVIDTLRDQEEI